MADLPVLKAGPVLAMRKERVDVPELGGAVIVRGLMASESFAISAMRQQAVKRLREAKTLSLNEAERRKEKERQEARLKAREGNKLAALDDGLQAGERSLAADLAAEKARKNAKDVLLTEAARIVADDADLSAGRTQLALRERVEISGGKGSSLR